MRKSSHSVISPFFAWTDAVLTGGKRVLEAMHEAAKKDRRARARVGVIPTADAPKARKARRRRGAETKRLQKRPRRK